MRVLLSWIGAQDPWIRPGGRIAGKLQPFPATRPEGAADGPILSFLGNTEPFDVAYLLFDPSIGETEADQRLQTELAVRHPGLTALRRFIPINDPRSYDPLYRQMLAVCEEAHAAHGEEADYNIFLSPGTPQMHAVWVLLSKTKFTTAKTWQGSDRGGSRAELVRIPFDVFAELSEARQRDESAEANAQIPGLILASEAMQQLVGNIRNAAPWNHPILLLGETGTGKSRIATLAHQMGTRRDKPFVPVECTSVPATLLESELFGHMRGAYSGADRTTAGRFRSAQGGTLFLDEVGDLPLDLQAKFLRVLQDKKLTPVGGSREESIDVRVVAATNKDLPRLTAEGKFREDLFYRLNTFTFTVPPLRHRREDIRPLAELFLDKVNGERKSLVMPPLRLLPGAHRFLQEHDWPGNVRQLESTIIHLGALSRDNRVSQAALEEAAARTRAAVKGDLGRTLTLDIRLDRGVNEILREVEERVLKAAMEIGGTQKRASSIVKLNSPQSLQYRLKRLLPPEETAKRRAPRRDSRSRR